jgi:hypothetical protein
MHLNLGSETSSALVLALCNPGLAVHFEWSILAYLYGSNHNPMNLHISTTFPIISQHLNWITGCADWEAFSQSLTYDLEFPSVNFMVKYFSDFSPTYFMSHPTVIHQNSPHFCPMMDKGMLQNHSCSEASSEVLHFPSENGEFNFP